MTLLARLPLDDLTPQLLWKELDRDTRDEAARALYSQRPGRQEADAAMATAIRFRESAVRKLPLEKRVGYLVERVTDDALATSLLMALHLERRTPLLGAFLDHLEIPHEDGLIDERHLPDPLPAARLAGALGTLEGRFPAAQIEVYVATLLALDGETWSGLRQVVAERRSSG